MLEIGHVMLELGHVMGLSASLARCPLWTLLFNVYVSRIMGSLTHAHLSQSNSISWYKVNSNFGEGARLFW